MCKNQYFLVKECAFFSLYTSIRTDIRRPLPHQQRLIRQRVNCIDKPLIEDST